MPWTSISVIVVFDIFYSGLSIIHCPSQ